MNGIVWILKSDFKESKNDKKTSQENLQFLKIMEEGIRKTKNAQSEMPLPFKERPLLPNNHSIGMTHLEYLKWQFQDDYIKFMKKCLPKEMQKKRQLSHKTKERSGIYLIMVSTTQRKTR